MLEYEIDGEEDDGKDHGSAHDKKSRTLKFAP